MSVGSILIVEDDKPMSRAIQATLASLGYGIRSACTITKGLAIALEETPDLLLLDLNLPDGKAWSLLRDFRQARPESAASVLLMSSDQVLRRDIREHTIDRFLPKPFDMSLLTQTVGELFEHRAAKGS